MVCMHFRSSTAAFVEVPYLLLRKLAPNDDDTSDSPGPFQSGLKSFQSHATIDSDANVVKVDIRQFWLLDG